MKLLIFDFTSYLLVSLYDYPMVSIMLPSGNFPYKHNSGNYVASVERKVTRQGSHASYVRLYTGWEGGDTTAMRARIAGCVTPATSHIPSDSSLEIIELPLRFPNTSHIACCQVRLIFLFLFKAFKFVLFDRDW